MSDPFVKDNPWTLSHMALWEASAARASCGGEGRSRQTGPTFRVEQMRPGIIDQMVVSLTSSVLTNHLFLGSRLSRRKSRRWKRLKGGVREVIVGKLNVEGGRRRR